MDDELDALLSAPSVKKEATAATSAAPAAAAAAAPAPAAAASGAPGASAATAMDDDSDDGDDDDDVGINLVLDAPSSTPVRGAGGAFGTPISLKTNRFSKWGAPLSTPQQGAAPATPAAPVTPAAAATKPAAATATTSYASSTGAAPSAGGSVALGSSAAGSASNRESSRPFRLPMPSEHIFDAGQSLDMRIERPWTQPGADPTDWFNYGFDEDTWKSYCKRQIQMRINAKMKGKLNVYEGDDSVQPQQRIQAAAPRPPMPPTSMPMAAQAQAQVQPQARPAMPAQGRPFAPPQGGQQISSFDGDDASVQLGGRGGGGGGQRFQQPMGMPMQMPMMAMQPQFAGAAHPFPMQPSLHAPMQYGQQQQQQPPQQMKRE